MVNTGSGIRNRNPVARESQKLVQSPASSDRRREETSVVAGETNTTTVTAERTATMTQTMHFFSLPLWSRKRTNTTQSPPRQVNQSRTAVDEHGGILSGTKYGIPFLEKDLPPTPDNTSRSSLRSVSVDPVSRESIGSSDMFHDQPFVSAEPAPPDQPTLILAQAALGLGLPHVMPRVSLSRGTELSSATLMSPPSSPLESKLTFRGIRKAKSSYHMTGGNVIEGLDPSTISFDEKRSRGLADPTEAPYDPNSDTKGKGKDLNDPHVNYVAPMPTVTRKSSFWSRKKSVPVSQATSASSVSQLVPSLSLPHVPPVSPLYMDLSPSGSTSSTAPQQMSLTRSRSERASKTTLSDTRQEPHLELPLDTVGTKRSRRLLQRPQTADPSQSRSRSLYVDPSHSFDRLSVVPLSPILKDNTSAQSSLRVSTSSDSSRRPRAQTNPPLLHRLSAGFFSSSSLSTSNSTTIQGVTYTTSPVNSAPTSPRVSMRKDFLEIPKPNREVESPEAYLERLKAAANKAEIAGILASSGEPFYARALKVYIADFDFTNDPLDVALRKLLMEVGLPRETQQIDRVIEAFANRYLKCNPDLFSSDDHPYILAFSLIMLHTDAFNRSNKHKMTKADYIKNTSLPGIASEVLDCFYDNIVFAPFIFIEDPLDLNHPRAPGLEGPIRKLSTFGPTTSPVINGSSILSRGNKIDPYYLITNRLLDPLRVNVEAFVPRESPYTAVKLDPSGEEDIRQIFINSAVIQVGSSEGNQYSSPFFGLGVGNGPSPLININGLSDSPSKRDTYNLRVTKVGLLNRRDEFLEGGKKASGRKWRPWSVILTGSQLLLFRDTEWATSLVAGLQTPKGHVVIPNTALFKPDELLSLKDVIAVEDKSQAKLTNIFRVVASDGRHILFEALHAQDLLEWVSRINYVGAFRTAGVRIRSAGVSGRDLKLMGVAAATSHIHSLQMRRQTSPSRVHSWEGRILNDGLSYSAEPESLNGTSDASESLESSSDSGPEPTVAIAPEIEGAYELKATFDDVKAELAAGRWALSSQGPSSIIDGQKPDNSSVTSNHELPLSPRAQSIRIKLQEIDSQVSAVQLRLDSDTRFVRNIAILTPFQNSTRDRLRTAIQNISRRISDVRLEISKLTCYRDVLSSDLVSEERERFRAKETAMQAAAEILHRDSGIPAMTVSSPANDERRPVPDKPPDAGYLSRTSPSVVESFHSALDFGPAWPSSDDLSSEFLQTSRVYDSSTLVTPLTEAMDSSRNSYVFPEVEQGAQLQINAAAILEATTRLSMESTSSPVDGDAHSHERFFTAPDISDEQAEEWDKTRCAKRVSLVRMPSEIRLSTVTKIGRSPHGRSPRTVVEEMVV